MIFQEESGGYIIVSCKKCGQSHKKHKSYCKQYGDEYHFNPPITCSCGNTDRVAYKNVTASSTSSRGTDEARQERAGNIIVTGKSSTSIRATDNMRLKKDEYEIQYEVDEKLPHTVLKNIKYYDEEENIFCNAMLELFGHCTKLITYESNGDEWKGIRSVTLGGSEFEISVLRKDGTDATVQINDNKYNMDIENLNVVLAYYNELNREFINARIVFKDKINNIASDLLENEAINGLLFNYIEQVSYHFFMNYKIIAGVESKIEDQDDIGKLLFISTEQLRLSIKITTEKKEGDTTSVYTRLENGEVITEYKRQSFDLLVDFLTEELGVQDDKRVALYLTYKLLLEVAKLYFSNAWEKEYGNYFTDIKNLSLINAIDIYCAIDSIDPKNLQSTGTLYIFL